MKLTIYSCECLLDCLIKMTDEEIVNGIMNHIIFSLSDKWLMFIHEQINVLFFCNQCININRSLINRDRIFCIKRSAVFDDSCIDFIQFSGLNNLCMNCLEIITVHLKKYLAKLKK